jgi:transposase InsO family protein
MERVAIDILGPLPITRAGNKYVLVMIDCFSKSAEAVALPNQEAATITKAFVEKFVCRFGTPLQIHSDQGRNFESTIFQEMCKILQIDKTRTTSYHPPNLKRI